MAILCIYNSLLRGLKQVIFGVWFAERTLACSLEGKHSQPLGACGCRRRKAVEEELGGLGILTDLV